tara:strand:- start:696 stop:944 length:249 start_codon:yes stop_codon:yes gene_type:complete
MGNLINVIAKYIQGLLPGSRDSSEKTASSVMIQLVLVCIFAIPYAFTFLPPGVTVIEVISAFIAFILIVVFALRVLKYFKLI